MKKLQRKLSKNLSTIVAALAVVVTSQVANSSCYIFMYQPELPDGVEQLYKND